MISSRLIIAASFLIFFNFALPVKSGNSDGEKSSGTAVLTEDSGEKDTLSKNTETVPAPEELPDVEGLSEEEAFSALIRAISYGSIKRVQSLINTYPELLNKRDKLKRTPLFNAVYVNQYEIVEILTKKGADLTLGDAYGDTPLHRATQSGNKEIMEFLIRSGASVWSRNRQYETPLFKAASLGKIEAAKLLISKEAYVNVFDKKRNTPLHKAALRGQKAMVKFLIENGADIKFANEAGEKPVDIAKTEEIKQILLEADPDSKKTE